MARTYFEGRVTDVESLCSVVRHIGFERVDGGDFPYVGGQFVMIHFVGREGVEINRSYSMADTPGTTHGFSLCVKRVDGGQGSTLIHNLEVGDELKMSGPYGRFTLTPTPPRDIVFVATGTGVAPFRAMRNDFEPLLGSDHRVWLLFGVRHVEELLYHEEWLALAEQYPESFFYRTCVSRPQPDSGWEGHVGYVSDFIGEIRDAIDPEQTMAYLCGVPNMINDMRTTFKELGLSLRSVRTEKYASPPPPRKKKKSATS